MLSQDVEINFVRERAVEIAKILIGYLDLVGDLVYDAVFESDTGVAASGSRCRPETKVIERQPSDLDSYVLSDSPLKVLSDDNWIRFARPGSYGATALRPRELLSTSWNN